MAAREPDSLPARLARVGLCVYSFTAARCDAYELARRALAWGLGGVEYAPDGGLTAAPDTAELTRFRDFAAERDLWITVAGGRVSEEGLRRWIGQAQALGAPVVRCVPSAVLAGNRRALNGGWQDHLEMVRRALVAIAPVARDAGVGIALENHQDVTSEELAALCAEANAAVGEGPGGPVGVTLDIGNALGVGEDPLEFARRVAPYVKNVHLKDYRLHLSPTGYRMARCALGDGVVHFPEVLGALGALSGQRGVPLTIELGASVARHVELLLDDWWADYPAAQRERLLGALRLAFREARPPDEEWRTPHERDAPEDERVGYELAQCERSVAYLRGLLAGDQAQLAEALRLVCEVLGEELIGAYQHGSAVLGGLREHSDLDVLVVTRRALTEGERRTLVHGLLKRSLPSAQAGRGALRSVELTVVTQGDVRPWRYPPHRDFQYGDWRRDEYLRGEINPPEEDPDLALAITSALAANRPLTGPPPADVLDSVPRVDLRRAMVAGVPHLMEDLEWDTRNVLLTLARIWVTLETGEIVPKDAAADWVLARLPEEHREPLEHARAIYLGEVEASWNDARRGLARTLAERLVAEIDRLTSGAPA